MRVGSGAGSVLVLAALCSCAPDDPTARGWPEFAPRSAEPVRLPAGPLDHLDHLELVVKFDDALEVRSPRPDALLARSGADLANVEAIRDRYGLRFAPLLRVDEPRLEALRARAQARSGRRQPDLMSAMRVDVRDATPELLVEVGTALQRLPEVELAYVHRTHTPPPLDLDPMTPALDVLQGYRGAEGIDADTAAAMGFDGTGIHISDVEQNWDFEHEDLVDAAFDLEAGVIIWPEHDDPNHGTSVVGTLIAPSNGYGITGMTPGATLTAYPEIIDEGGTYRRADAIASAAASSNVGDVILLEIQETEPLFGNYAPGEIEELVWMITRMATDAGVVVVAAAGNGNVDLDAPELAYYRDRGDSGAIIVGAGTPSLRDKLDFSTYGSRVDVQGWGIQVFTTGYGNYAMYGGDTRQAYTATFSGTSSASPIVTAAAVLVQQAAIANLGAPLTSQQIRAVLIGTGLPQGLGGHIGPLPQVPAAIAAASTPDVAAPDVTIITPSDDIAVEESSFMTSIEIDARDDSGFVAHVQLSIAGEVQPIIDEIEPWAFENVTFPEGTFEIVAVATDVWGNVGESAPLTIAVGVEPMPPSTGAMASSSGASEESTAAPEPPSASTTGDEDDEGESTGDPGAMPRGDEGCGCRTRSAPHAAWLFVLAFAIRRRSKSVSA